MRSILILLFHVIILNSSVLGQNQINEPIMNLDVYVDGEKFQIKDGDTLNINNSEIIVKSSDYLTFDFGVIKFDYPKHFAYTYEEDIAYKNWTLDGNDLVIMYFEIGTEVDLELFIKEIVNGFGKKKCEVTDHSIQIGSLDLKGKRINIEIIGQKLTYDMYELKSDDSKSHFIAFQDAKNEDGSDSNDSVETLKIINNTIHYK